MQYRKREVITAVSILVATLAIIFYVIPNHIDLEEEFELASLSPAFFPNLAAWIIAALAGLLAISTLWEPKKMVTDSSDEEWLSRAEERNAYKAALVIVVYVLAMKYIGFLIATVLALAVLIVLQDIKTSPCGFNFDIGDRGCFFVFLLHYAGTSSNRPYF